MNTENLTEEEFSIIRESLNFYRQRICDYDAYPSYEFKQEQLKRVDNLLAKLKT